MTLYEQILSMSIEDMAIFLYELCHEQNIGFIQHLNDKGIPVSLIEIDRNIQIAKNIKLLESEREE
jgi:hypothetical protein